MRDSGNAPATNGTISKRLGAVDSSFSSAQANTTVSPLERTESEEAKLPDAEKKQVVVEEDQEPKRPEIDLWFFDK